MDLCLCIICGVCAFKRNEIKYIANSADLLRVKSSPGKRANAICCISIVFIILGVVICAASSQLIILAPKNSTGIVLEIYGCLEIIITIVTLAILSLNMRETEVTMERNSAVMTICSRRPNPCCCFMDIKDTFSFGEILSITRTNVDVCSSDSNFSGFTVHCVNEENFTPPRADFPVECISQMEQFVIRSKTVVPARDAVGSGGDGQQPNTVLVKKKRKKTKKVKKGSRQRGADGKVLLDADGKEIVNWRLEDKEYWEEYDEQVPGSPLPPASAPASASAPVPAPPLPPPPPPPPPPGEPSSSSVGVSPPAPVFAGDAAAAGRLVLMVMVKKKRKKVKQVKKGTPSVGADGNVLLDADGHRLMDWHMQNQEVWEDYDALVPAPPAMLLGPGALPPSAPLLLPPSFSLEPQLDETAGALPPESDPPSSRPLAYKTDGDGSDDVDVEFDL